MKYRHVLGIALGLLSVQLTNAQQATRKPTSPRWYADVHAGALPGGADAGQLNHTLAASSGYRILPQHAIGVAARMLGYSGAYNNAEVAGLGARYRYTPWRWLATSVEGGYVLQGTRGGDFTMSEPAGAGGTYIVVHIDYRTRMGFTVGAYFGGAQHYHTLQRTWSWDMGSYGPSQPTTASLLSFGVSLGWSFPPTPKRPASAPDG